MKIPTWTMLVMAIGCVRVPVQGSRLSDRGRAEKEPVRAVSNHSGDFSETPSSETKADRIARIKKEAADVYTPRAVKNLIESNPKGLHAGDDEVTVIIGARIQELIGGLGQGEPEPELLITAATYMSLFWNLVGTPPDVTMIEAKYGPLMEQEPYKAPRIRQAFLAMFPRSSFAEKIQGEQAAQARQVAIEIEEQDLWLEVQGHGDQIATLAFKIRFAGENYASTRRLRRGIENMQLHRQAIIRDAFCPAKRKMIGAVGANKYQQMASDHCSKEPPVDSGTNGTEVILSTECREAFTLKC